MQLYIVSQRSLRSAVAYDPLYELENLIAHTCDATILAPRARRIYRVFAPTTGMYFKRMAGLVRRTVGIFEPQRLPPKTGPEIALCIGIAASDLLITSAIPNFRRRFDVALGYVFDAWSLYPDFLAGFDRMFVPLPDELEQWQAQLGVPATLIPFGVDALHEGGAGEERPIDLISYGRIPPPLLFALSRHFNHPRSRRLFLRTAPRDLEDYPEIPYEERSDHPDSALLYQLLRRSKASLCFDTLHPGMRRFPYSFVTLRWFDAFATGCVAVGRRPSTREADRLMPWDEACVDLPDDPRGAIDVLENLFDDVPRLRRIQLRNHYEALARHDWRLRLRDMLRAAQLELPAGLARELDLLEEHAELARMRALDAGALPQSSLCA